MVDVKNMLPRLTSYQKYFCKSIFEFIMHITNKIKHLYILIKKFFVYILMYYIKKQNARFIL